MDHPPVHPFADEAVLLADLLSSLFPALRFRLFGHAADAALYVMAWHSDGALAGGCRVAAVPATRDACEHIEAFFGYTLRMEHLTFDCLLTWRRWQAYQHTGQGLRLLAGGTLPPVPTTPVSPTAVRDSEGYP